ncbi:MAG: hypothetical protein ACOC56_05520, partial [Atribacterota bacterium]
DFLRRVTLVPYVKEIDNIKWNVCAKYVDKEGKIVFYGVERKMKDGLFKYQKIEKDRVDK